MDDEPDFLSKKDAQKTVHVCVLYQRRVKDKAILASVTQSRRSPPILRQLARRTTEISAGTDYTPSTRTSPSGGKQTAAAAVGSPLLISTKRDTFKHTRDPALPSGPARTPPLPSVDSSHSMRSSVRARAVWTRSPPTSRQHRNKVHREISEVVWVTSVAHWMRED